MIELIKVEMGDLYGKVIYRSKLIKNNSALLLCTNDKKGNNELYLMEMPGDANPVFLLDIDDCIIHNKSLVLKGLEWFKSTIDDNLFYYVSTFEDDIRLFANSEYECILHKLNFPKKITDLVGITVDRILFEDAFATDAYISYNGISINLYAELNSGSYVCYSTDNKRKIASCTILDVNVTLEKNIEMLSEFNKHVLEATYGENPEDWDYVHMQITFKTSNGEFYIMFYIPDTNGDDINLEIEI